jgi:hypothetical protein
MLREHWIALPNEEMARSGSKTRLGKVAILTSEALDSARKLVEVNSAVFETTQLVNCVSNFAWCPDECRICLADRRERETSDLGLNIYCQILVFES